MAQYYYVEQLHSAQLVDEAIFDHAGTDCLVVVQFGRIAHADWDWMQRVDAAMDAAAERVGPVARLYAVDIDEDEVQDFNAMYELHKRPCTLMFFYRNRHVEVRGPLDDIVWSASAYNGDEFADLVRAVHRRAKAGQRLVVLGCQPYSSTRF